MDALPVPVTDLRVVSCPHPFSQERVDFQMAAGSRLNEILAVAGIERGIHTRVFLDDWYIPPELYHRVRPKPGHILTIRAIPTGGGHHHGSWCVMVFWHQAGTTQIPRQLK
jgi:hypothetical protein